MRLPLILSLLLIAFVSSAGAVDWQSADFNVTEKKRQLDSLIEFPEATGNISVTISCFSQIQTSGKMKETGCYSSNQFEQTFAAAVSKAARKARMNPAIIAGKTRKIFLQFRVEFNAEGAEEKRVKTIDLHLNPGYEENIIAYGFDHIAGQRAIDRNESWQKACPRHAKFAVWARAYLGVDGRAESPTIEHATGIIPTAPCMDAIKRVIVASRYVPATSEGVAVPSTFVEIFGN